MVLVHTAVCQKAPAGLKQHLTVNKPVALAVIKLRLSEGISKVVS